LESNLHSPVVRRQFSNPGKKEKQNCLLLVTTPVSESKNKYIDLCFTTQFWNPENSHLLHCQFWNKTMVVILDS
jgi:hypothetical protein